ncbi:alpha/beta fold hydrolase [Wenxinia marina]|uniref:Putative hydrolase or acyltransferase (Alpha/beta hydrolase superfamily) n=1 Tax=Wenxinia marina DSM 24838 TaxID=1123501 RepID=A0A0D0QBJ0_9RHOB|nr:alpha/beta hydrolase [Wenxinia marina]KIQ68308.1 putative hydrolase or acyltransferase (alpha/beta hydrolase superfamily) [Wenxinia marina DSM 24838]GGL79631.1 hydrolase [Wenxinia marina]
MDFTPRTADLPQGTLHWHEAGAGKPVLYLHAAAGLAPSRPLRNLTETHRVLAPIAPGFDGTDALEGVDSVRAYAALVADFIRAQQIERLDVIGASFGAWVAQWLAIEAPDLVDHLILQVPAGLRFGGKGGLPADPEALQRALYAHPDRIDTAPKSAEVRAGNAAAYGRYSGGLEREDADMVARLGEIEATTLILIGTEDPVVPPEAAATLKREIRQSQRVFVFDAAHSIEVDQPDRVGRLWQDFLARGRGFVLNRGTDVA